MMPSNSWPTVQLAASWMGVFTPAARSLAAASKKRSQVVSVPGSMPCLSSSRLLYQTRLLRWTLIGTE